MSVVANRLVSPGVVSSSVARSTAGGSSGGGGGGDTPGPDDVVSNGEAVLSNTEQVTSTP